MFPVGHGQTRRAWVVIACLGYSRVGAGALIFSKEAPDVLWGMGRCLWSLGALAKLMVWDREGCLHAGGGRPTDAYASFCGQLLLDWYFCEAKDPQAKGVVERLQGYPETNFEPGRRFANRLNFQLQLDAWFEKANARTHRALKVRPINRLAEEHPAMRGCRRSRPMSTGIGCCGWHQTRICVSTPTTIRSIPTSLVGASKSTSPNARSQPSSLTRARLRAVTSGASLSTSRSPRLSTPGRSESAAANKENLSLGPSFSSAH
jgi:hypothetical protein